MRVWTKTPGDIFLVLLVHNIIFSVCSNIFPSFYHNIGLHYKLAHSDSSSIISKVRTRIHLLASFILMQPLDSIQVFLKAKFAVRSGHRTRGNGSKMCILSVWQNLNIGGIMEGDLLPAFQCQVMWNIAQFVWTKAASWDETWDSVQCLLLCWSEEA